MKRSRTPWSVLIIFISLGVGIEAIIEQRISRVLSSPPNIRTSYYKVSGSSPAELLASIGERRPYERDGHTDWYVKWRYRYASKSDGYRITSFATDVEITYSMPEWVDQAQADPEISQEWQRYIDCLTIHEDLHGQIAIDCAGAMEEYFGSNSVTGQDPEKLDELVATICHRILDEKRAEEVAYDDDTDFGRTQGARLKFPLKTDSGENRSETLINEKSRQ